MIASHAAPMIGWDELLPDVPFAINTARNFTTGETPFKLLYNTHPRDGTSIHHSAVPHESAEQFLRDRNDIRAQAEEALQLAQSHMAIYHDRRHSPIRINGLAYLRLTRKTSRGYRTPFASLLDVIKDGPFKVIEKIGKNAFKLDLPPRLKIHLVILTYTLSPLLPTPTSARLSRPVKL
jgi:hypothetical protein